MEENNLNLNEGQENVVDSPIDTTTEQVEATVNESSEVVDTPVDNKPVQSAEENAKFASIRRQAQQEAYAKAQDELIAQMFGESHGFYTKADYDRAVKEQKQREEAEKKGIDPELYKRINDLEETANSTKAEKEEYKRQLNLIKEHETLSKDETFSDYYNEHSEEIKTLANDFKVDLQTAMLLSIKDNFKNIVQGTAKKVQQETINNIIKNQTTSPGSMSSATTTPPKSAWEMSDAEFKAMTEKALRGEIKEL